MDRPDLDDIARRPRKYWDIDGLPELVMGGLWMLWGTAWLVGDSMPRGDWTRSVYWLAVSALLALSGFAAAHVIKRVKARVTFPRTGYVEWKEPTRRTNLTTGAVAIVTALVLVLFVSRGDGSGGRFAAPVLGVILSLGFLVASVRNHSPHYLALAGVAVALGVALGAIGQGWTSANWLFVAIGAATALAGALRLAIFISRHPRGSVEGA